MSQSDGGAEQTPRPMPKQRFYDLCVLYNLYYDDLLLIAEQAGVTKEVIDKMFVCEPVNHSDAVSVLKAFSDFVSRAFVQYADNTAFSQQVGTRWTMDNTRVPTIPEDK